MLAEKTFRNHGLAQDGSYELHVNENSTSVGNSSEVMKVRGAVPEGFSPMPIIIR